MNNTVDKILKPKQLKELAGYDVVTSVLNETTIPKFCRAVAKSMYPESICYSIADHIGRVQQMERELIKEPIEVLKAIQVKSWKYLKK